MPAHSSGAAAARSSSSGMLQHEVLVDHDRVGVAAVGRLPGLASRRRCRCRSCRRSQYCSRPSLQLRAAAAESTMQPTPTRSPTLNLVTSAPTRRHAADDLVAGHAGIGGPAPLAARRCAGRSGRRRRYRMSICTSVGPGRARSNAYGASGVVGALGGVSLWRGSWGLLQTTAAQAKHARFSRSSAPAPRRAPCQFRGDFVGHLLFHIGLMDQLLAVDVDAAPRRRRSR